jgi:HTH-type transcriptional regulator, sugar sensing transcriptional regulator
MVSHNILSQIGFSDKEAKIYLACLELGTGTVVELSRKSGITRGSTYDILEEMLEKGYVSRVHKDKHMVFSAVDPEALKKRYQDSLRDFELALPELKGLFHKHSRPRVRYFEGIDGIKRVYEDTLTATTEILNYANSLSIRTYWPMYDEEYVKRRVDKKIFLKGIAPDDDYGKRVKENDKNCLRETRLLPSKEFMFTNEINIYDNKLAITSFSEELIGIIIESEEIADTQRDIFKMSWAFAGSKITKPSTTVFVSKPINKPKTAKPAEPIFGQQTLL